MVWLLPTHPASSYTVPHLKLSTLPTHTMLCFSTLLLMSCFCLECAPQLPHIDLLCLTNSSVVGDGPQTSPPASIGTCSQAVLMTPWESHTSHCFSCYSALSFLVMPLALPLDRRWALWRQELVLIMLVSQPISPWLIYPEEMLNKYL